MGESNGIDSLLGGWAMPKAYSGDMRQRVIAEVESGASRRAAAEEFAVSASTAIIWVKCFRETGRCALTRSGSELTGENLAMGHLRHIALQKQRAFSPLPCPCRKLIPPILEAEFALELLARHRWTKAHGRILQVRPNRLAGRSAERQVELRQQVVESAAVEFTHADDELWPARGSH
jgi:transposase-like protein